MYDLLSELSAADIEDRLPSYLKKISKLEVLVIDDFLLTPTTEHEQKYLMGVFELRSRHHSLILSSQMETGEWHKKNWVVERLQMQFSIGRFQTLITSIFMVNHYE